MTQPRHAHGMMLATSLLAATSFPVSGSLAGQMDSGVLALLRFGVAAAIFTPLVVWRYGRQAIPTARSLAGYAALSALLVGFFLATFEALRTTTPLNTGALFTLTPAFTAVIAFTFLRERIAGRRLVALVTGLVGALWVVFQGDLSRLRAMDLARGDLYFTLGTLALGTYAVLVKRLRGDEPLAVMTLWTLLTGTGWLLAFRGTELAAIEWAGVAPGLLGSILYLAVFATLVTFLLTQGAVHAIGPTRAASYNYLTPGLVALLAWASGDAPVGWATAPGIALTLLSMAVLQRGDRLPAPVPGPPPATYRAPATAALQR